jgi:large conductance mechanosensitive channel
MRGLLAELKTFVLRGNVVDLAVGVVIGIAFGAVVQGMVRDLLTPLIAAIIGKPDFSALTFQINGAVFRYGDFLNLVIAFVMVVVAVFFFVVKPLNVLTTHFSHRETPEPSTRKCPLCLMDIPLKARRCAFCTTELAEV